MISPEKSQVEICLLKYSLGEIENELVEQRSAWPKFDAENEQKLHGTLKLVKESRALAVDIEAINEENVRLVAKRMHLKVQNKELAKALEKAQNYSKEMEKTSNEEKQEIEQLISKYEDLLSEKSTRLRESRAFFNESEMKEEIQTMECLIAELERDVTSRRTQVEILKRQFETLSTDVPENLIEIIGKNNLDDKVKALSEKCDALQEKRNELVKNRNNASFFELEK